eukprot:2135269-Pleurochrysis_carterae.AAC.2
MPRERCEGTSMLLTVSKRARVRLPATVDSWPRLRRVEGPTLARGASPPLTRIAVSASIGPAAWRS